ncbi:2-oxoglutarate dehydrogenase, mitochondrial [Sphaeroforma arctica JP610]|uniref:2-oxoglutarate dehydrogenase, mitochondrial n=1 Tax=Sphaeroforma arctica JP610 TaxID=667725 RepID=A0A0L0FYF8_9EUKA|nr:2-oxoglutarate dehydrogenase, mitochondrial [Sphaeroforma arctica JP610]KNC81576.1 2-oxoglutarate dehydrogenase, mitochondrial [Sphaeroforma arctica JP610]|eukprot:XP_014155478.1 2-oxoglutarate dehydrogenase, mitochondrial [Sphaeroforma arctica JP610]
MLTTVLRAAARPMAPTACVAKSFDLLTKRYQSNSAESFMNGSNSVYMDEMYTAWKEDPSSVHKSWDSFFKSVDAGMDPGSAFAAPPGIVGKKGISAPSSSSAGAGAAAPGDKMQLAVQSLVRGFQVRGHNVAQLDPLGIMDADLSSEMPEVLVPSYYGLEEADMEKTVALGTGDNVGFLGNSKQWKLGELIKACEEVYCGTLGYEYMHILDREKCNWLRERIETPGVKWYDAEQKKTILDRLIQSDGFENFLKSKWSAEKRFGLEGLESAISGLKHAIDVGGDLGVERVVIGMPHRGRLNVLGNVVKKPLEKIFAEFSSELAPNEEGSGDVKYHLGSSLDRETRNGKPMHLSLLANPSHLEAADPVVLGKVKAEQFYRDGDTNKIIPFILHGDAAFSGQGIVYECFNLGGLTHYSVGGTIHVVCNNQIGFTTDPRFSRSSPYCTDVGKSLECPIFHCNADDPEAVVRAMQLAIEWRQHWKSDAIVDIIGYRRYGHNEIDQPSFTQPKMYSVIAKHTPALQLYKQKLMKEGVITEKDYDDMHAEYWNLCENAYNKSKTEKFRIDEWMDDRWKGFKTRFDHASVFNTGTSMDNLKHIGNIISSVPKGFSAHSGVKRVLKARKEAIDSGAGVDWATAEALAFGTLLREDYHVRLSGQDVERGTFSQRHHVLHDQNDETTYTPLENLGEGQARYSVCNSSLSEYGVLGFELGYSMANPNALVMWEGQFGDFANGAQIIFDQFLSSGEQKWLRQCGLTVLLPHGYEGQGPEHSSARLERFLQMSDDPDDVIPDMDTNARNQIQNTNWQVMNCSTPANYYHALRRQVHREFRKPLILMTPKKLLRLKACTSTLDEMADGTRFRRVINEESIPDGSPDVKRVVFCSGKVRYELMEAREKYGKQQEVAIATVEQISPFPFDLVNRQMASYPNADVVWVQEEPKNMGAWSYVNPRMETALSNSETHKGQRPRYIGRASSASTATGVKKQHKVEEEKFLSEAMDV